MLKKIFLLTLVGLLFIVPAVSGITAEEIIENRDNNEHFTSARMEAEMIIEKGDRRTTKEMVSIIEDNKALTRFVNPQDRGTKFLKRGDELFLFFPDAEDIVRMSGHMLDQNMMGSDYSYQDMMESDKLTDLYEFEILEEEDEIEGRPSYKIEGIAKEGVEVSYYRRIIWVDKERFVGLKEELYAESGRLLKESLIEEMDQIDDRWYPVKVVTEDKLKKDTRTILQVNSLEFDPEIPEDTFTMQNLR
ncbi:MAG: outer membrane lipoprotein-sorting protein [Bacillota bacterium]